jgi:uncharacterized protein YjeT (DUF2065 family)
METWKLFLIALGIVLVIEGTPYAFFPAGMKRAIGQLITLPDGALRVFGFILAALGFLVVFLAKGC